MEFFAALGQFLGRETLFPMPWRSRLVALRWEATPVDYVFTMSIEDLGPLPKPERPPLTDPLLLKVIAERRAAGLYS